MTASLVSRGANINSRPSKVTTLVLYWWSLWSNWSPVAIGLSVKAELKKESLGSKPSLVLVGFSNHWFNWDWPSGLSWEALWLFFPSPTIPIILAPKLERRFLSSSSSSFRPSEQISPPTLDDFVMGAPAADAALQVWGRNNNTCQSPGGVCRVKGGGYHINKVAGSLLERLIISCLLCRLGRLLLSFLHWFTLLQCGSALCHPHYFMCSLWPQLHWLALPNLHLTVLANEQMTACRQKHAAGDRKM